MALLLYTSTLFAGWASLAGVVWKLWSIYYSKALFPMLLLVRGSKGVCLVEGDAALTQCH